MSFASLVNYGSIATDGAISGFGVGVELSVSSGGSVTNKASGSIGVALGLGGSITNASSASIIGYGLGVEIGSGSGSLTNDGIIMVSGLRGVGVSMEWRCDHGFCHISRHMWREM